MKVRKMKITAKLLIIISLLILAGDIILGLSIYNKSNAMFMDQIRDNLINLSTVTAANIDGDLLACIEEGDEGSEEYNIIIDQLALVRDNAEVEYVYTAKQVDEGAVYIVDSDKEEPADIGEELEITDGLLIAFGGEPAADSDTAIDEWGTHLSAYAPVYNSNGDMVGIAGVDISVDFIKQKSAQMGTLVSIVCFVIFIITVSVLLILAKGLSKSLNILNEKILDLANGSGDLTRNIDIKSGDEFEIIAGNINIFIEEIRELISQVNDVADKIRTYGDTLNENISSGNEIMLNMNDKIDDISASMEESGTASDMASGNLDSTVKDVRFFGVEVNEIQKMVTEANQSALEACSKMEIQRQTTSDTMIVLKEKMGKVSKDASKINQVREMAERIATIAGQTRMLSLNAQIEAARAGEQGRGFAVVATEVGRLSEEIDGAVNEIAKINTEVTAAVNDLLSISNEMTEFMTERIATDYMSFAELGQEYGSATEEIRLSMNRIKATSDDITLALEAINESIQEINKSVNNSANQTFNMAEATGTLSSNMSRLKEISFENAKVSEDLGNKISKYKY